MNPFEKYLTPENHLQIQVCKYLKLQYPNVWVMHPPNESRRSRFERFLIKIMGVRGGESDLIFFKANRSYHGLALELKVIYESGRKNKLSPRQEEFLEYMNKEGYLAKVAYTFEEAKQIIDDYFKQ